MLNSDCVPTASLTAALSLGSTLKASAIQELATSTFSASSEVRVPSFSEAERKSIMDRARRFFESERDYINMISGCIFMHLVAEFEAYHSVVVIWVLGWIFWLVAKSGKSRRL
jgi:hypothetical protein